MDPFDRVWSTAAANQTHSSLVKSYRSIPLWQRETNLEWAAHRAASVSSVRLKLHIVVHRQLSALGHIHLRTGVRALGKSDPRDWSSKTNPFHGAWSTPAANQTNPRKIHRKMPHQKGDTHLDGGLTAPPFAPAALALNTTWSAPPTSPEMVTLRWCVGSEKQLGIESLQRGARQFPMHHLHSQVLGVTFRADRGGSAANHRCTILALHTSVLRKLARLLSSVFQ